MKKRVSVAAIRALAILGEHEEVCRAIGRPSRDGRGIRILSMDGGGMKVGEPLDLCFSSGIAPLVRICSSDIAALICTLLRLAYTDHVEGPKIWLYHCALPTKFSDRFCFWWVQPVLSAVSGTVTVYILSTH